ncbi:MAG: CHAT domain-containing protein [bacterium]|nr:CHAT domain-containing protein [bacterium]
MKKDSSNKPVIFLAFANVRDDSVPYLRNLPDEHRSVRSALEQARTAGLCEIVERANATAKEILDVFQHPEYRNRIAIFHYGGHANGFQLLLEATAGGASPAFAVGFAEFLGQQQGLQLVFLNGCSTQPQVHGLLEANVSAVIATSQSIADQLATDLAARFYNGLAGGATIRTAYNEAVASIKTEIGDDLVQCYLEAAGGENRWPWDIYVRDGAEITDQWNLPQAAHDPLFGLPSLPTGDLPAKPYRHLQWFERDHAEVFFGRNNQIRELYDRVTSPHTAPIILVYGQSGVGKSSLLAAGLLPRLEANFEVRYLRRMQEGGLVVNLKAAIAAESNVSIEQAWLELENQLKKPVIIILDQVEEVFTQPNLALQDEFFDFLEIIKTNFLDRNNRPAGKLVLGFRKEWLAEIEKRIKENKLPISLIFLERLDRQGVIEIVAGLTKSKRLQDHYGLIVEDGLPEMIADDMLSDPESPIAPILQILLTKMWDKAKRRNYSQPSFTIDLYLKLKKQGILLNDFLEQQIEKLSKWRPEVVASGLALEILALHTTPLGTAEQRSRNQLRKLFCHQKEILPALIQKCKDLYLLVDPAKDRLGRASGRMTRLSHDTLAPIIRQKYEKSDKPGQRAFRILASKIVDFDEKKTEIWIDETDLKIVECGLDGMRHLDDREKKIVEISREKKARKQKVRKTIWAAGITMAIIIIFTSLFAWKNTIKARQQARIAKSNYLAILANDIFKTDKIRSLRIAEEAYRLMTAEPPDYLQQLMHTIFYSLPESCHTSLCFHHAAQVSAAAFSPDGKKVLTGSWDKTAKLWTVAGDSIVVFKHNFPVTSVSFSPDGKKILTSSLDNQAKIWTLDGDSLAVFRHQKKINSAVFSPDGRMVLTASSDSTAKLWAADGVFLNEFRHNDQVHAAAFSPDDKKIVTASFDKTAKLWSISGDSLAIYKHNDRVYSAEFSSDGKKILTGSWDKTAKLWTLRGKSDTTFDHDDQVFGATFSHDNRKVLTVCMNKSSKLWTITGDSLGSFKSTHQIYSAEFSPDDRSVLIASGDKTAKLLLTPEGIYAWLQTAPIYHLTDQEKRELKIID